MSLEIDHGEDEPLMDAPSNVGTLDPAQADTLVEMFSPPPTPPPKPATSADNKDDLDDKIKLLEPFDGIMNPCAFNF